MIISILSIVVNNIIVLFNEEFSLKYLDCRWEIAELMYKINKNL